MAERRKSPWAVFVGGPLDGQRELLQTNDLTKPTLSLQGHDYEVTSEFKTVNTEVWQVRSRVLMFIRTLTAAPRGGRTEYVPVQIDRHATLKTAPGMARRTWPECCPRRRA
jgi:hypothetical protein